MAKGTPEKMVPPAERASKGGRAITVLLVVLLLLSAGANMYFFAKVRRLSADPVIVARNEASNLVAEVGKLIILPKDEVPTIATVTDPEQLKGQAFFTNAQKGYKVLLYASAKKAFLYDPEAKRIIEVAPINASASDTSAAPAPLTF